VKNKSGAAKMAEWFSLLRIVAERDEAIYLKLLSDARNLVSKKRQRSKK
jgi:hypothetical protein